MNESTSSDDSAPPYEPQFFPSEPAAVAPAPELHPSDVVFQADRPDFQACSADPALAALADLIVHAKAQTPLTIGLLGEPGSGKTSALGYLTGAAEERARQANIHLQAVRIDAAGAGEEPDTLIAAAIFNSLAHAPESPQLGSLAREAVASLRDVHAVAREAADRLAEMRETLEQERRNLESVSGRRARLAETVLFETPGSRVDAYARAHRVRIEARLRAFGFEGDLIAVWKELVREMSERTAVGKFGAALQSLWAYRGQTRLLILTIVFGLLAIGIGEAGATRAGWIASLRSASAFSGLANWLDAHGSLFGTLQAVFWLIAALCLAAAVFRAVRFLNPIFRGASLLSGDLEARQRDLDALLAHQTRQVDLVSKEVEAHARRADDAERRAEGPRAAVSRSEEMRAFYGGDEFAPQARLRFAREFVAALERLIARDLGATARIFVAVDGFEALAPDRSMAFLKAAGRLLARPGFVAAFAFDPDEVAKAEGAEGIAQFARIVQIPVQVQRGDEELTRFAGQPSRGFDAPFAPDEQRMLDVLAPMAGRGPREGKRFTNLYRLARAALPQPADPGALALAILATIETLRPDQRAAACAVAAQHGFPVDEEKLRDYEAFTARFRLRN